MEILWIMRRSPRVKVPEGQAFFVKIENKYQSGILLLVITNSKTERKNKKPENNQER